MAGCAKSSSLTYARALRQVRVIFERAGKRRPKTGSHSFSHFLRS